jgi:excinuclease ABC subunit C
MQFYRFGRNEYSNIPEEPGVYKYFNKQGTIIYVGKAKNLKKRVSSYFNKIKQNNRKTLKLVSEIASIEITIVNSEFDALLLENGLIKENQPKYNILLKDDKSYPSIVISNDRFPKIYATRRIDPSKGEYFGPFTSVKAMNSVIELVTKLFKIRTCNLLLSEKNIKSNKFKICLEYHLENCKGPCVGHQTESQYLEEINQARQIIKGNVGKIRSTYKEQMQKASDSFLFELAQSYKERLDILDKFQSKSTIVNPNISNTDVITIIQESKFNYINYMKISDGSIVVSDTFEVSSKFEETIEDILNYVIPVMQNKFQSTSKEILSNHSLILWNQSEVIVPQIGDKKKLIDLSIKNVLFFKKDKEEQRQLKKQKPQRLLKTLQDDLRLKYPPDHIECFDNSNIQGTNPVASMVCFKNAKPSKKDYRKFNIKTVDGPDDFGSMKEIVFRRYKRLLKEKLPLPKLIVIDGGKGQLNAAIQALKQLDIYGQIPVIGIAKRLEEIYYPEDPVPIHISKKSESLKVIQHLRDEAHRFAITFHRNKRSKNAFTSSLDSIRGIGPKTKEQLVLAYGSVRNIENSSKEELIQIVGAKKAQLLQDYFQQKKER